MTSSQSQHTSVEAPVRQVTHGPKAHFFGYYEKTPWDDSGRRMLALEAEPVLRMPLPGEEASIQVIDLESGRAEVVARTRAWNWQQGCMLQWLPDAPDRQIVYNDRPDGTPQPITVIQDVRTGERRVLPLPMGALSADGRWTASISFGRMAWTRPVCGYAGVEDPLKGQLCPDSDGVWVMDMRTGHAELVLSLARAAALDPLPAMRDIPHFFNHVQFSPSGHRIMALHRWLKPDGSGRWFTRMLTFARDGTDLHCLADGMASHWDWRDDDHLFAWAHHPSHGDRFYLFRDRSKDVQVAAPDVLTEDGHCSYSPDRRWILSDTYPRGRDVQTLFLFEPDSGRRVDVARFNSPPEYTGDVRCDLHPRWSRDGTQLCVDSTHDGTRQVHVIDVTSVVSGA
jgi:hypothetical protein